MAVEFWFEKCFYVLYCGIYVMLENHMSSFYNIVGYVLLIEKIKYCAFSRSFEKKTQRNTTTPIIRSVITSKICQDGDIQVSLVVLDTKSNLILERQGKIFIPKVYSEFVFKICGALMIEAQLSPKGKEQQLHWEIKQKISLSRKGRALLLFVPSLFTRSVLL
ncbi:hypothetical protein TNCV_1438311 [Trichonephila clavipes]|nr:hypothetical protein TNCV_1438311 [Trichonephila clavipes]